MSKTFLIVGEKLPWP